MEIFLFILSCILIYYCHLKDVKIRELQIQLDDSRKMHETKNMIIMHWQNQHAIIKEAEDIFDKLENREEM